MLYILHVNDVVIHFTRSQKGIMLKDNVVQSDDRVGYYLQDVVIHFTYQRCYYTSYAIMKDII